MGRINACTNPSFEVSASGWAAGASTTIARDVTTARTGAASLRIDSTAAGANADMDSARIPVNAGEVWTISYYARGTGSTDMRAYQYDAATGGTQVALPLSSQVALTSSWQRVTHTFTISAGATHLFPRIYQRTAGTLSMWIESILIEKATVALPYFDGSVSEDSTALAPPSWSGTPGLSASYLLVEPVVTVEVAFNDSPFSASPVWSNVSAYVRSIDVKRGRNMELSQFDTGTLSITLDNNDGYFTPRLGASLYNIRPKRPVRVTVTHLGVTYPIGQGVIERWPATIGDGDLTVTVPASDAFRLLADTGFPESDTGMLVKSKPKHYWPLQGSDPDTAFSDVVGYRDLGTAWASPYGLSESQIAAGTSGVPLPAYTYGAASIMPSGGGESVDFGAYWQGGGLHGARCLSTNFYDEQFPDLSANGFTLSAQVMLPTLTHPDGSPVVIFSASWQFGALTDNCVNFLLVYPDGSLRSHGGGASIAPAGTIQANTSYRLTVGVKDSGTTDWAVTICVNGTVYTGTIVRPSRTTADGKDLYIGGTPPNIGKGAGGRWAHVAMWNRLLTTTEMVSLWSENLSGPGMLPTTRINRVLDYIGWPTAARDIQAGKSTLVRDSWDANASVLTLIQKWASSDGALLYMSADGKIVYRNRHDRITSSFAPYATFDCAAGNGVETGLEWVMDENDITNVVNLDVNYGLKAQVRNEASIDAYGERPVTLSLDVQSDPEGRAAADDLLSKYAQPIIRVSGVQIFPTAAEDDAFWAAALAADIGKIIRLSNLPATAPAAQLDYYIESINHRITRDGTRLVWSTSFDVSPVFGVSPWILGDATRSVLGSTTRLAY